MRRAITTAIASALLALALPMAASAHHHKRHHHAHHARVVVFHASRANSSPTPTTPTTPTTEGESAGTIASYENGVLKLTLADGSSVSGKVVEGFTEIQCEGAQQQEGSQGDGGDGNGEFGDDDGGSQGGDQGQFQGGDQGQFAGHGDDEHGGFPPQQQESSCGTSALIAGAKVSEAELKIGPSGSVWEQVDLLAQQK